MDFRKNFLIKVFFKVFVSLQVQSLLSNINLMHLRSFGLLLIEAKVTGEKEKEGNGHVQYLSEIP